MKTRTCLTLACLALFRLGAWAQRSASGPQELRPQELPTLGAPVFGEPAQAEKSAPSEAKAGSEGNGSSGSVIDLATALRLAGAQNPQVLFARERIVAAQAEVQKANVLWLPSLAVGTNWLRHDGQIQAVEGRVFNTSRGALFAGGSAVSRFDIDEAMFEPRAARSGLRAVRAGEQAATNDILLDVALAYWDLVRGKANLAISEENLSNARKLDDLAQSYLKAQKLKLADAERARVELRVRAQEVDAAREAGQLASVRLARQLRLDPFDALEPAEDQALPVTLVDGKTPPKELAALALGSRPELAASQALVRQAQERLRRAELGPLLPSVLLGASGGVFGGGRNAFLGDFDGRSDVEVALVWETRNLGLGDRALQRQRASEVRQAQLREIAEMDRVVAEVADALRRLQSRQAQMESARLAVESATRSFDLNWKLFKEGGIELIRPIEVLQSIQALARARQDYLTTIIEHNRAQFQLYWALGLPVAASQDGQVAR